MTEYSADDPDFENEVQKRQRNLHVVYEAKRRLVNELQPDVGLSPGVLVSDLLAQPPEPLEFVIEELFPAGANVLLVAEKKAGKTTLVNNLSRAVVDDAPFLGEFAIDWRLERRVGYFNYELFDQQMHVWLHDQKIRNPHLMAVESLRGKRFALDTDAGQEQCIEWLQKWEVDLWIIDTFRRAYTGESQNDNDEVARFTAALDYIKDQSDCNNLVLVHHTGRQKHEEGEEHGRGATELDDWADVRWILTKDKEGNRWFRADGRDVSLSQGGLTYDANTRHLTWTLGSRSERVNSVAMRRICAAVAGSPGVTTNDLKREIGGHRDDQTGQIQAAVSGGYIRRESGARNAFLHYIEPLGERVLRDGFDV